MTSNFQKLKKAHSLLMSKYVDVLNQMFDLPFFVPAQFEASYLEVIWPKTRRFLRWSRNLQKTKLFKRFTFSLRYLVRLFVELHIRARLLEISVAYTYLAQKHLEDEKYVSWLRNTSGDCAKLAETLTSWQSLRTIVSVGWPFILSAVTAAFGLETIYDIFKKIHMDDPRLILFGFIMVFPIIYLALFVSAAFESKRELFMPGFDRTEEPLEESQPADINNVVYVLEDQVFSLAGRRKSLEIPLDVIGIATSFFYFASFPVLVWIDEPSSSTSFGWLLGVLFALEGILFIVYGRKRKWR